jgi:hypothetical protein
MTIDDASLREPFGHVDYNRLLREMERHNFHTTIAFIPWNFDRSEASVVSLFQAHRDRYSICLHGNNHDHREFGPYSSRPLDGQIKNVKQGLARMARFRELTHLEYDPVMVFPHAVAPERTFAVLKRYNFLATANSLNVPLDAAAPSNPEFALRTSTMAFTGFPSLRRYSAEASIPEAQIAVDAFLGNPMLFYVHQNFFASGIGAFNAVADRVNRLRPGTQWRSLGFIARHLYLEKVRADGNYDVRAYSRIIRLDNVHQHAATFFVERQEHFDLPLRVMVDGQEHTYERSADQLRLRLDIPAGETREISIVYENHFNIADTDVSKRSFRINTIRRLSDFRDDVVSKSEIGRWLIQDLNDWSVLCAFLATVFLAAATAFSIYRRTYRSSICENGGSSRRVSRRARHF